MTDLALVDLFRPYVLLGEATDWHAALSVIYVESYETALSDEAAVIRGVARFSGDVGIVFDPSNGSLRATASNTEGHPRQQPGRREPWLDITDTRVEFALTAPRTTGQIIAGGVASVPGSNTDFNPVRTVLQALDPGPGVAPSDYPGTGFTLDLMLAGIILRPPFLKPARMEPDGLLVPDPGYADVSFTLPRIKLRLAQGSDNAAALDVSLASLGAAGLDDPGALEAAELISMTPPYAFIGEGRVVGFGFRSAVLDLSDGYTPPAVLEQFGFDDSWTGLYLPEIRLFVAPNGMQDLAVDAGVRNLLIGLGDSSGVTGDFELMVINQGAGNLGVSARFFDADGRAIGITRLTETTAEVVLPERTRMVIDITGGRAPYSGQATINGSTHNGIEHDIDLSGSTQMVIGVSATDTSSPNKSSTLSITARRRQSVQSLPPPGTAAAQPAVVRTTEITLEGQPQSAPELVLVRQDDATVTVSLNPPDPNTQWAIGEGAGAQALPTGPTATFALAAGASMPIQATLNGETVTAVQCFFRFDRPENDAPDAYALDPDNTNSSPAVDPGPGSSWMPPATPFLQRYGHALQRIAPTTLTLEGRASYENNDSKAKYNYLLARRRANALRTILQGPASSMPAGSSFVIEPSDIGAAEPPSNWVSDWKTHGTPRNQWWQARIKSLSPITLPGTLTKGEATRPAAPPPPPPQIEVVDRPPTAPQPPDWFRSVALKVRIVRDQFVAVELSGSVDFQTAAEERLRNGGASTGQMPQLRGLGSQNPSDGIVDYRVLYQTDPASQTDQLKLYLGADPEDRDGLLMTGALPGQALAPKSTGRNMLGMAAVLTPLLAEVAPANPADGSVTDLVLTASALGLPLALAELGLFTIERVVLYGGELDVTTRAGQWVSTLLFDVETAISMDIKIGSLKLLEIPRDKPLSVRYKAIGIRMGYPPGSAQRFQLRPMFDSSRGYSIDLSGPGAVKVADPLGQILQVLGARIARTNPLTFEIDIGFAVDLGVVAVERARVRLPVDPLGTPELTALAASINVPGTIEGRGYLEINDGEIKGQIDVSLVPLKLRLSAGLGIKNLDTPQRKATAVIIALELELPVAIPLANSGFGLYGLLGLFAMHYARDETSLNSLTPALQWLKEVAKGDPTRIDAWRAGPDTLDRWAFGVGAILGTMEGGVIFNVKGMVLLELPGPRLLLVMRANLLAELPGLKDKNAEGTFLCVIDLDFGRGTLTIGLSIDFAIKPIVQIQIPVEAYFDLHEGSDWHLYLGTFPGQDTKGRPMPGPVHANILQVFDGSGYVMVSGHGIPAYGGLSAVSGVALAAGLEVSITWGNVNVNLYLRATAGFNAVLGFDPFYVGGTLYARGELHLFILSLSASAKLTVQIGERADGSKVSRIDGDVCGEIDLFFFTLKGCVKFHLGETSPVLPLAPELVRAVTLTSRSPALVVGTGVDRGIDSKIGDALQADAQPPASSDKVPVVPIDAIPVIIMSATPVESDSPPLTILGQKPSGSSGAPAGGYVSRGDYGYRYELKDVTLELAGNSTEDPVSDGPTPSTWWTHNDPSDGNLVAQLSLLNWVPNATPKALERSEFLEENVKDRWGTICHDAAPAAPVLWTFENEPIGPSANGWTPTGTAWPDPPDSKRSVAPDLDLAVWERWRSGDTQLDWQRGVIPAIIVGAAVPCRPARTTPQPGSDVRGATTGTAVAGPTASAQQPAGFTERLRLQQQALSMATAASVALRKNDIVSAEPIDVSEAIRRIATGVAINRSAFLDALSPAVDAKAPPATAPDGRSCTSRLLASPQFDIGVPVVFGDLTRSDEVARELEQIGHKHGPLDDVVVVDSGPVVEGRILVLVRRDLVYSKDWGSLVVRFLDPKGGELGRRVVDPADQLAAAGIPARWSDPSGPWADPVFHVLAHAASLQQYGYVACLVPVKREDDLHRIEIGLLHADSKLALAREGNGRPYYLAVLEFTRLGEAQRETWDQHQADRNREVVEQLLGPDSGAVALLRPGRLYCLRTTVEISQRDPAGTISSGGTQSRRFWFRTDSDSPKSLEPWMLCTLPGADEAHYFGGENVRIVFATNDVDRLWAAYGKELRVRLKAASFRQVDEPGIQHPVPLVPHYPAGGIQPVLGGVTASVLSPFEAALVDGLAQYGPCVAQDETRVRHSQITIPIPLEPFTDYVLDIEAVALGAPANATGERVLRRHFSTGAYASLEAFAESFQGAVTEHRYIEPGAAASIAGTPAFSGRDPQGAELDEAMIGAGLEPMAVPASARLVVFWEQGAAPATAQPVAVLLDASEPMRRERMLPQEVTSDDDVPTRRWKMVLRNWLDLVEAPPQSGHAPAGIARVLWAPGCQRALVVLASGARGKRLRLAIERKALTEAYLDGPGAIPTAHVVVDEILDHAPWEEL